jgi:hypothetical protein
MVHMSITAQVQQKNVTIEKKTHELNEIQKEFRESSWKSMKHKIYSKEHKRKSEFKNGAFKVENDPTEETKLILTVNRQTISDRFKELIPWMLFGRN